MNKNYQIAHEFINACEKGNRVKIMELLVTFDTFNDSKPPLYKRFFQLKTYLPILTGMFARVLKGLEAERYGCNVGFNTLCHNGHVNIIQELMENSLFNRFHNPKEGITFFIEQCCLSNELNNKEIHTIEKLINMKLLTLPKKSSKFKDGYMQTREIIEQHDSLLLLHTDLVENLNVNSPKSENKRMKI